MTSGENDEEAAWLDLIANYNAPANSEGEMPWPEREDLTTPDSAPITGTATRSPEAPQVRPSSPLRPPAPPPAEGVPRPEKPQRREPHPRDPQPQEPQDLPEPQELQEEHYVPPPPPPLPKLDPITKGAWTALFGGPAYLLIATALGWTVPAIAAFLAIGAFVGGFAVLVLRMGDEPKDGSGPDDGAVVLPGVIGGHRATRRTGGGPGRPRPPRRRRPAARPA